MVGATEESRARGHAGKRTGVNSDKHGKTPLETRGMVGFRFWILTSRERDPVSLAFFAPAMPSFGVGGPVHTAGMGTAWKRRQPAIFQVNWAIPKG